MAKVESEPNRSTAGFISDATVIDMQQSHDAKTNGQQCKKGAAEVVAVARAAFRSCRTKSIEFRRQQLKNLVRLFDENTKAMEEALAKDLRRHRQEASSFDILYSKNDILKVLMHLDEWTKPEQPSKPMVNALDKIRVYNDPYGVVLVMSAWNFPINLVFVPLAGAIAAGNCAVIKPSEIAEATAELIADLVPRYLDKDCYQVFSGGISETTDLLDQRFDYIFFTGSTNVGKIIHAAANKYLTPVTLELGGKSPVYIDKSVNLEMTVRRILWGKCSNAGQVCIGPDYVLCTKEVQDNFVAIAKKVLQEWYGSDIKSSPDYCRIVSDKHFTRLMNFLKDKQNIAVGGGSDTGQRFIEPTILTNVSPNDPVMQEEIFGPILPIITIENPYEAISFINAREKPLALYVFTNTKKVKDLFLNNTSSGGISINDTLLHFTVESLPFGGVGFSGMGAYHGKATFDTFSHKKSFLERNLSMIAEKGTSVRYPPYSDVKMTVVTTLMKPRKGVPCKYLGSLLIFFLGIVFIVAIQIIYYCVTNKHLL